MRQCSHRAGRFYFFFNSQRELRNVSGLFEKANAERQSLAHEVVRSKELNDRLELQLSRLGDVQAIAAHRQRLHSEVTK